MAVQWHRRGAIAALHVTCARVRLLGWVIDQGMHTGAARPCEAKVWALEHLAKQFCMQCAQLQHGPDSTTQLQPAFWDPIATVAMWSLVVYK